MYLHFKSNGYTYKQGNSVKNIYDPLVNRINSKGKELATQFLFGADPFFLTGLGAQESKQEIRKVATL